MLATIKRSDSYLNAARRKIIDVNEVQQIGPVSVLTRGAFDLLHSGHLNLLTFCSDCSKDSGILLVAVWSDEVVQRKKGLDRPIQKEEDRALQVASVPNVDYVVIWKDKNLNPLIKDADPKFYVKGMDTALEESGDGKTLVEGNKIELISGVNSEIADLIGTRTQIIVFCDNGEVSTSSILKRITSKLTV